MNQMSSQTRPQHTKRLYSLDALRATMMLLGIVLHVALTYTYNVQNAWALKDPQSTSKINDILVDYIHVFRMPIFFMVSGFFGAMLFYNKGPAKMLKNRILRILCPLAIFLLVLSPTIVIIVKYSNLAFSGHGDPAGTILGHFLTGMDLWHDSTYHLWFLYYLFMITVVVYGLGLLFTRLPKLSVNINNFIEHILQRPLLKILCFTAFSFIVSALLGMKDVKTSTSFIPDFNTFLFYFQFYIAGWLFFSAKQVLNTFMTLDWFFTILAMVLTFVTISLDETAPFFLYITLKSATIWLYIFGITGLFIRYTSHHSARIRYVSDASYWVYLIHLPFTGLFPGLLANVHLPSLLKVFIVIGATAFICFLTYHLFVRSTFIGKFLHGRAYSRKISDIKSTTNIKSGISS